MDGQQENSDTSIQDSKTHMRKRVSSESDVSSSSRTSMAGSERQAKKSKMMKTPVTVLQELMVKFMEMPEYECVAQSGPQHLALFEYRCSARGHVVSASARSKKEAKQEAARLMLHRLAAAGLPVPPAHAAPAPAPPAPPGAAAAAAAAVACRSYKALLKFRMLFSEVPRSCARSTTCRRRSTRWRATRARRTRGASRRAARSARTRGWPTPPPRRPRSRPPRTRSTATCARTSPASPRTSSRRTRWRARTSAPWSGTWRRAPTRPGGPTSRSASRTTTSTRSRRRAARRRWRRAARTRRRRWRRRPRRSACRRRGTRCRPPAARSRCCAWRPPRRRSCSPPPTPAPPPPRRSPTCSSPCASRTRTERRREREAPAKGRPSCEAPGNPALPRASYFNFNRSIPRSRWFNFKNPCNGIQGLRYVASNNSIKIHYPRASDFSISARGAPRHSTEALIVFKIKGIEFGFQIFTYPFIWRCVIYLHRYHNIHFFAKKRNNPGRVTFAFPPCIYYNLKQDLDYKNPMFNN